jgi:outer membrane protein OmpA-like peptidoglycan-associated protein
MKQAVDLHPPVQANAAKPVKRAPASAANTPSLLVERAMDTRGVSLDASTRALMNPRFAHDLSRVRVHAGPDAADAARAINASAFTVGHDVFFASGQFRPSDRDGRRLLAHELAHTAQQPRTATPDAASRLPISRPDDPAEREAEEIANRIGSNSDNGLSTRAPGRAAVKSRVPLGIQRQSAEGSTPHFDLAEGASPLTAAAIGSVTLDGFEDGSSDISAADRSKLDATFTTIQTLLKKYPGSVVRVIRHASAAGAEAKSPSSGQARAGAVKAALLSLGLSPEQIVVEGENSSAPSKSNADAAPARSGVDVRFEPISRAAIKFPKGPSEPIQMPDALPKQERIPGIIDLHAKPVPAPPQVPPWMWKQLPPNRRRLIDDFIDASTSFLSPALRDKARKAIRDAIADAYDPKDLKSRLQKLDMPESDQEKLIEMYDQERKITHVPLPGVSF